MPASTPSERRLQASAAAYIRWSRTPDSTAATAPARQAFLSRFERLVDPDGVLPPEERAKLAARARKGYFHGLAAKSARARRKSGTAA